MMEIGGSPNLVSVGRMTGLSIMQTVLADIPIALGTNVKQAKSYFLSTFDRK